MTQYELWKAIWSSLNDRNFFELAWRWIGTRRSVRMFVPLTFVGNHDVTRIASNSPTSARRPRAGRAADRAGMPSIYYGDEQVRPRRQGGTRGRGRRGAPGVAGHPGELRRGPGLRLHQQLIGLRRRHPWLTSAHIEVAELANEQLAVRLSGSDGQRLTALLNIADDGYDFEVADAAAVLLSSETTTDAAADRAGVVSVGDHGWAIVRNDG